MYYRFVFRGILFSALCISSLGLCSSASATNFGDADVSFHGVNPRQSVRVISPAGNFTTSAGDFNWTNHGVGPGPLPAGSVVTHCIELDQSVGRRRYDNGEYQVVTMDETSLSTMQIASLHELADDLYHAGIISSTGRVQGADSAAKNMNAAAFQMAVWEIVNETAASWNVITDAFRFDVNWSDYDSTLADKVNKWLSALNGKREKPSVELYALASARKQDQMFVRPTPIPEPSSILGWLVIVGGLTAYCRRRRSR